MHIFIVILFVCCVAFGTIVSSTYAQNSAPNNVLNQLSGDELFERGKDLTAVGRHEEAANLFWGAVMKANGAENYKVNTILHVFYVFACFLHQFLLCAFPASSCLDGRSVRGLPYYFPEA